METKVWDGELYMQLRDGRFVPYVEWLDIRRRDPLEEMRWREVCRRMDRNRPADSGPLAWRSRMMGPELKVAHPLNTFGPGVGHMWSKGGPDVVLDMESARCDTDARG